MSFEFKNWNEFGSTLNRPRISGWLGTVRKEAQDIFKAGMLNGPHTGRIYRRKGRLHRASVNSAEAEYPANDTGALLSSLKTRQTKDSATIGTNVFYSRFLRTGTSRMQRRRMSDNAMKESLVKTQSLTGWVKFARGKQRVRNLNR